MWGKRTKIKKNKKEAKGYRTSTPMLSCAQKEFYLIMPSFYSKDFVLWNVIHTSSLLMWGLVTASFPGFTPLSRWRLTSWKRSRPWERGWIGEAPTLKKSLACFSEGIRCLTFGRTVFLIFKMNLTSEITESLFLSSQFKFLQIFCYQLSEISTHCSWLENGGEMYKNDPLPSCQNHR